VTKPDQELLLDAISREGEGHRLLLSGEAERAIGPMREAAELYRRSWELAPPRAFGRLVGMLKASVLAGDSADAAAYAREALESRGDSAASWYALALVALIEGDDELAARAARGMREEATGDEAFLRTADAIEGLAGRDREGYARAVTEIVADFESRDEHLTGVPIADTALMLERLAEPRGIAAEPSSPLLP
jgi:tetratricopeptide (TPR) repeat protein